VIENLIQLEKPKKELNPLEAYMSINPFFYISSPSMANFLAWEFEWGVCYFSFREDNMNIYTSIEFIKIK
jgi:hypothetical protein